MARTAPITSPSPPRGRTAASVARRRLLGSYYTPEPLARVLVQWALADGDGPVLDPSYGGCAFLEAAAQVLSERDRSGAGKGVYGVDIDPDCAGAARESDLLIEDNCIVADFLSTSSDDLPGNPYRAIVGNPPYVRHHWIAGDQRDSARAVAARAEAAESPVRLPATASLWAYFLVHSLGFLSRGGRLAMLVPEAILQTDYADPVRKMLGDAFQECRMIRIRDRQFAHTDEAVVALACSGFGKNGTAPEPSVDSVDSVERLRSVLLNPNGLHSRCSGPAPFGGDAGGTAAAVLRRIRRHHLVQPLGKVASVRVGVVTGANRHFIRSRRDLDALGVPVGIRRRIVSRTRWLEGLKFTECDHEALAAAGAAALLVRPESREHDTAANSWIQEGLANGSADRYKCAIRSHWYRVDMPSPPAAFATCARAGSPLLVLNQGSCLNTNALHSLGWKADLAVAPKAVAVGFLTSAVAAWAEREGRRYGGGVLKMEPGALQRVPVPLVPGAEDEFDRLDRLLREGREEDARKVADERVLRAGLGLEDWEIESLRRSRAEMMKWRRPSREGNGHA